MWWCCCSCCCDCMHFCVALHTAEFVKRYKKRNGGIEHSSNKIFVPVNASKRNPPIGNGLFFGDGPSWVFIVCCCKPYQKTQYIHSTVDFQDRHYRVQGIASSGGVGGQEWKEEQFAQKTAVHASTLSLDSIHLVYLVAFCV